MRMTLYRQREIHTRDWQPALNGSLFAAILILLQPTGLTGCKATGDSHVVKSVPSSELQSCNYDGPDTCSDGEFCINFSADRAVCWPKFETHLLALRFPFEAGTKIVCDQGALTPRSNSHSWLNTAFALDLQSDRSIANTPILAGVAGRAIVYDQCRTENDQCGGGFGNYVKILTDEGFIAFYAHLKEVFVETDDLIEAGQMIGWEGTTGWTGEGNRHLHLSVHHDWRPAGFEYWKQVGYLPTSVPFKLQICRNSCDEGGRIFETDIRNLDCQRNSELSEVIPICGI